MRKFFTRNLIEELDSRTTINYARVSSHDQKEDLIIGLTHGQ